MVHGQTQWTDRMSRDFDVDVDRASSKWAVSGVAARANVSDLAGWFVVSRNTDASIQEGRKRRRSVDPFFSHWCNTERGNMWTAPMCAHSLRPSSRNNPTFPQSSCLFTLFDHGPLRNMFLNLFPILLNVSQHFPIVFKKNPKHFRKYRDFLQRFSSFSPLFFAASQQLAWERHHMMHTLTRPAGYNGCRKRERERLRERKEKARQTQTKHEKQKWREEHGRKNEGRRRNEKEEKGRKTEHSATTSITFTPLKVAKYNDACEQERFRCVRWCIARAGHASCLPWCTTVHTRLPVRMWRFQRREEVPHRTMPRSGLVAGRRPEWDLQRQVQQISNSHAPRVPSMSEDPSPERDQASAASTPSLSFSLQSTQQSVGKLAEGLEEKFTRRLALVEEDLNQKLGKLVEVTIALSLVSDERFAGLESRLSTNGHGVHPPSGSVASVEAPNFSHLHGKLLDLKCALPVQDFNAESAELREKLREQRVEFETAFQGLRSDLLLLNFRMEELRVPQEVVEAPCGPLGSDGHVVFYGKGRSVAAPVCQHSFREHPLSGPDSPSVREVVAQGCLRNLSHSTKNLLVQSTETLITAQCSWHPPFFAAADCQRQSKKERLLWVQRVGGTRSEQEHL